MDVMRPSIICVGKRCYRMNPIEGKETEATEEDEAYYEPGLICTLLFSCLHVIAA